MVTFLNQKEKKIINTKTSKKELLHLGYLIKNLVCSDFVSLIKLSNSADVEPRRANSNKSLVSPRNSEHTKPNDKVVEEDLVREERAIHIPIIQIEVSKEQVVDFLKHGYIPPEEKKSGSVSPHRPEEKKSPHNSVSPRKTEEKKSPTRSVSPQPEVGKKEKVVDFMKHGYVPVASRNDPGSYDYKDGEIISPRDKKSNNEQAHAILHVEDLDPEVSKKDKVIDFIKHGLPYKEPGFVYINEGEVERGRALPVEEVNPYYRPNPEKPETESLILRYHKTLGYVDAPDSSVESSTDGLTYEEV